MMEFLKRATEWVLDKEEEAARECRIDLDDIQKQIDLIKSKRDTLKKEYEENIAQLEHILRRLEVIKAKEESCSRK